MAVYACALTTDSSTAKRAETLSHFQELRSNLDAQCGAQWFSTIDLASGYNQVPVAEKDKMKTAFCTPFGLFDPDKI